MRFGLCNAPVNFQRIITLILHGLTWKEVLAYMDDVIVLGKDMEEAPATLGEVFRRPGANNLKFKPNECNL